MNKTTNRTDAERLSALVDEWLASGPGRTKKHFATASGVSESYCAQHRSGIRPISMKAAIGYARALGVPLERISPERAAEAKAATGALSSGEGVGYTTGDMQAAAEHHARSLTATYATPGDELASALSVLAAHLARPMPEDSRDEIEESLRRLVRRADRGDLPELQRQVLTAFAATEGERSKRRRTAA